jgi:RNA polymerase sigma factor (TIGR02999 family)
LPAPQARDVTELLLAWGRGNQAALDELVPLVYAELRRLARRYMREQRRDHTLQTTALVHEAYLRLIGLDRVRWQNRDHFLTVAARLMRRVLVDSARAHGALKRGAGVRPVTFDEGAIVLPADPDLIALDDALKALATLDPRKEQVVELRYFGGLSVEETARVLGVSTDTVMRDWKMAKLWLVCELSPGGIGPEHPHRLRGTGTG